MASSKYSSLDFRAFTACPSIRSVWSPPGMLQLLILMDGWCFLLQPLSKVGECVHLVSATAGYPLGQTVLGEVSVSVASTQFTE